MNDPEGSRVGYPRELPGLSQANHLSFFMFGATLVQTGYHSMEIIDSMDKMTPVYGYPVDLRP
jgi:hypothetical protein